MAPTALALAASRLTLFGTGATRVRGTALYSAWVATVSPMQATRSPTRNSSTCEPTAVAPTPATPGPAAPAPPALESEPEPEANRLAVKSVEFYYVLSRPSVKAGEVTIELNNQGEDAHNLNLRREGDEGEPLQIAETASDQRSVASFDLPAGKYKLWCSLPTHEEEGMSTTLVVE